MISKLHEEIDSLKKENEALKSANLVLLAKYGQERNDNIFLRVKLQCLEKKLNKVKRGVSH